MSPTVAGLSTQSLVVHHFAHWLWVVAGAVVGYQFRDLVRLPGRTLVAWAGLAAAFGWHLPPLLSWAETNQAAHIFAHATLLVGGGALGWAVPQLSGARKAALFIAANVVMWPIVLAELANAFVYPSYARAGDHRWNRGVGGNAAGLAGARLLGTASQRAYTTRSNQRGPSAACFDSPGRLGVAVLMPRLATKRRSGNQLIPFSR